MNADVSVNTETQSHRKTSKIAKKQQPTENHKKISAEI